MRFKNFALGIFVGFLTISCNNNHDTVKCEKVNMFYDICLIFNDSSFKTNYPIDSIEINVIQNNTIESAHFISKESNNFSHIILLDNIIDNYSIIDIKIKDKEFILSDFEINKKKISTFFGGSYATCLINRYKVNGQLDSSSFQIKTGLQKSNGRY